MKIKLKQYCDDMGISVTTGYRWFNQGLIPGAEKTPSGTILVDANYDVTAGEEVITQTTNPEVLSLFFRKTLEYSKSNKTIDEFAAYIFANFSLRLMIDPSELKMKEATAQNTKHLDKFFPKKEKPEPHVADFSSDIDLTTGKTLKQIAKERENLNPSNPNNPSIHMNSFFQQVEATANTNVETCILDEGNVYYYKNKLLHREKGPAIEYADGTKEWCINGLIHREDGPAVEYADGTKIWLINGERHRNDGPAVEDVSGYKEWWVNGERHRLDGPAIEYASGNKVWFYHDRQIICSSQQEFEDIIKQSPNPEDLPDHLIVRNESYLNLAAELDAGSKININNPLLVKPTLYDDKVADRGAFKRVKK